jgi:uncharacterized Zn-binding protein involved in type VI secretion
LILLKHHLHKMPGTARLGDSTIGSCRVHGPNISGTIISASSDTMCNGRGTARLGDIVIADCGHEGTIVSASTDVMCNNRGTARLGDSVAGIYTATIISASTDTFCN